MSYCLYLRKSRADLDAERAGEGETLARHEHRLMELAKRLNLNVTEIYREIVSGETLAARPVMQQLLSEVEIGMWEGVLVVEVERLARGETTDQGIVAQAFKYSGTKIITPAKIYDPENEFDEEYFEFGLFMSRREYRTINRRLNAGRDAAIKEGRHLSNVAPYGYEKYYPPASGRGALLRINEEQAAVVRMIFDLYQKGEPQPDGSVRRLGCHGVASRIGKMGIKTPRTDSTDWSAETIRNILTNPVYAGKVRWRYMKTKRSVENGIVTKKEVPADPSEVIIAEGLHDAIVSEEQFLEVQDLLRANINPPLKGVSTVKNSLAGLLVCGVCGHIFSRKQSAFKNQPYRLLCRTRGCPCRGTDESRIESAVLSGLREWVSGYAVDLAASESESSSVLVSARAAHKAAESELKKLSDQQSRAHDLLEQGIYDTETFLSRSRLLSERISDAESRVSSLAETIKQEERREANRRNIIPKVQTLLDLYDTLPDAASKNAMLKEVLEKVVYLRLPGEDGKYSKEFEITLYPKLPQMV